MTYVQYGMGWGAYLITSRVRRVRIAISSTLRCAFSRVVEIMAQLQKEIQDMSTMPPSCPLAPGFYHAEQLRSTQRCAIGSLHLWKSSTVLAIMTPIGFGDLGG